MPARCHGKPPKRVSSYLSGPDPLAVWRHVAEWLRLAADDTRAARLCISADPPLCGVASYHCQQAAEKLLKGFLVFANVHFRKTHDLEELAAAVVARFPSVEPLTLDIGAWSVWNVAHRYPGETGPEPEASPEELQRAIEVIVRLEAALRTLDPSRGGTPASQQPR